jgi:hypothetical protein
MEKEFVTYEQALALKELGFDEECMAGYDKEDNTLYIAYLINAGVQFNSNYYDKAPLKQQVFRWFRENHNWTGGVRMLSGGSNYLVGEFYKDEDNSFMRFRGTYDEIENDCINELIDRVKE